MSLPRMILALTAVGFLGFGLAFTLRPDQMAALIEIALPSATARVDFAATYGGFELGVGAFCCSAPGGRAGSSRVCWPRRWRSPDSRPSAYWA
jgi:hypothetical protein